MSVLTLSISHVPVSLYTLTLESTGSPVSINKIAFVYVLKWKLSYVVIFDTGVSYIWQRNIVYKLMDLAYNNMELLCSQEPSAFDHLQYIIHITLITTNEKLGRGLVVRLPILLQYIL